jgi:hypothetical protein
MPCLVLAIGENDLECYPEQRLLEYVRLIKRYQRGMWKERRNKACQKKLNVIRFSYLPTGHASNHSADIDRDKYMYTTEFLSRDSRY